MVKLGSCLREESPEENLEESFKLVLAETTLKPDETLVRIVAYATGRAVDFDLPVYRMSSGRWLINEKRRVYLVDEACRQYKLKDRGFAAEQTLGPQDGRIRLSPGQAFEATLSFPRLPDQTRMGVLVYGERRMLFTLWKKPQ